MASPWLCPSQPAVPPSGRKGEGSFSEHQVKLGLGLGLQENKDFASPRILEHPGQLTFCTESCSQEVRHAGTETT